MLRRPKHSKNEVVVRKEEEDSYTSTSPHAFMACKEEKVPLPLPSQVLVEKPRAVQFFKKFPAFQRTHHGVQ